MLSSVVVGTLLAVGCFAIARLYRRCGDVEAKQAAREDLREAAVDFRRDVIRTLRVPELVAWLQRRLTRRS